MSDNFPYLEEIVKEISPFPNNVVIFGMANDRFPVCYDVSSRHTPNVLIWDYLVGQGIKIIKTAIEFILRYKKGSRTEFVVFSNRAEEWKNLSGVGFGVGENNECVAVIPFKDEIANKVLFQLSLWCQEGMGARHPILVFVDGLENIEAMGYESKKHLKVILSRGRNNGIYVIGTASSLDRDAVGHWSYYFQREIEGLHEPRWFVLKETQEAVIFFTPLTTI